MVETPWQRRLSELLALLIGAGFLYVIACFHVPAHGGADQNGYLVGGKMMLANGASPKWTPRDLVTGQADPFQFVGPMWVGVDVSTPEERYYPKYPPGFPALVAAAHRLGDEKSGTALSYWISPICMTVAGLATFLLVRPLAGSLGALLGQLVFLFSPITLGLADNPNSHAAAAALVALGMYLVLRWQRGMGVANALAGALLLGCAATMRYTEALMLVPILVIAFQQFGRRAGAVRALLPPIVFLIPVAAVVAFNFTATGALTGYDATRESSAFSWRYFVGDATYSGNWENLLRQFNSAGLPIVFPLAIAGLLGMIAGKSSRRTGWILLAWAAPTTVIYGLYYWAPDGNWIGYLRFFFTIFPALIAAAFWLLAELIRRSSAPIIAPLAMACITALAVLLGWHSARYRLEQDQVERLMVLRGQREAAAAIPPGSVLFAPSRMLNHLQFAGDYLLYSPQTFHAETLKKVAAQETEEVLTHHPARAARIIEMLGGTITQEQLAGEQRRLIDRASQKGIRIFFMAPQRANQSVADVVSSMMPGTQWDSISDAYKASAITRWNDPNPAPREKELRDPRYRRRVPQPPGIDPSQSRWAIVELRQKPTSPATTRAAEKR